MNFVDIILVIPLIWFTYKGFTKGLIIELTSLAALILGIYASMHFSGFASGFLIDHVKMEPKYITIVSFAITFIVVVILVFIVGNLAEKIINMLFLGFFNKVIGAIFGLLKISLIISTLIFILNIININILPKDKCEKSFLYKPVAQLAPMIIPKLIGDKINFPVSNEEE